MRRWFIALVFGLGLMASIHCNRHRVPFQVCSVPSEEMTYEWAGTPLPKSFFYGRVCEGRMGHAEPLGRQAPCEIPLSGVSVTVTAADGTTHETLTDDYGYYRLPKMKMTGHENDTFLFSKDGYSKWRIIHVTFDPDSIAFLRQGAHVELARGLH